MDTKILLSITVEDLQRIIMDSVNACLLHHAHNPQPEGANKPLSVSQAAKLLNLAPATIYSLCSQGVLPYSKKGKRLYFSQDELLDWVQSGRRKTVAEVQREVGNYLSNRKKG